MTSSSRRPKRQCRHIEYAILRELQACLTISRTIVPAVRHALHITVSMQVEEGVLKRHYVHITEEHRKAHVQDRPENPKFKSAHSMIGSHAFLGFRYLRSRVLP